MLRKFTQAVPFLNGIRELSGSNLGRETKYPVSGLLWFYLVPLGNFHNIFKSFSIHCNPIIRPKRKETARKTEM
jgi:hypothetical protein